VEPKARRIQNRLNCLLPCFRGQIGSDFCSRAAQRAFRERKQSQLAELQARVQSYEQGEVDKTVGLQKIAKHLKEENDKLRQENRDLQTKLAQMENVNKDRSFVEKDKKRWRDDDISSSAPHSQSPVKKKSRAASSTYPCLPAFSQTYLPSPSSLVSTPDSNKTNSHFSVPCDSHIDLDSTLFSHQSDFKGPDANIHPLLPFSCGFCDEGAVCVCRDIVTSQVVDIDGDITTSPEVKLDAVTSSQIDLPVRHDTRDANIKVSVIPTNGNLSILDNLPGYQPPVPLKRRSGRTPVNSVFRIQPAPTSQDSESGISGATCSGDPSNCMICVDDSFGKAFCTAITTSSCHAFDEFPGQFRENCCKNGSRCDAYPSRSSFTLDAAVASSSSEFIPTNDAWQKLKAHPKVDFADLSLLAEVVANRTKCAGPQLVISSTPSTQMRGERTSGADRHGGDSPIRLVDENILLECGRRRIRQVHMDGVQEALRMLDAKFC
jgi:hypothetical protein